MSPDPSARETEEAARLGGPEDNHREHPTARACSLQVIPIDKLRLDGGTQPRAEINLVIVNEYAEAMTEGATFPPITVFFDGADYWVGDGFHRYHAARQNGFLEIEADVRTGTQRDAVLFAVGANAAHGMRRTPADKRRAVLTLLDDGEWSARSNPWIAKQCAVSEHLVRSLRPSRSEEERPTARTYTDKHGNIAVMNVEKIGKRKHTDVRAEDAGNRELGEDDEERDADSVPQSPTTQEKKTRKKRGERAREDILEVFERYTGTVEGVAAGIPYVIAKYSLVPEVQAAVARFAELLIETGQSIKKLLAENSGGVQ